MHRVGRAKASSLGLRPRPGSCRERPRRVTTSWSIPNSPPDGPQVRKSLRAVCFFRQLLLLDFLYVDGLPKVEMPGDNGVGRPLLFSGSLPNEAARSILGGCHLWTSPILTDNTNGAALRTPTLA